MKKFMFNGLPVYYRKEGSGEPVLLVHGFAEDHRIWDEQVEWLKQRFTVLAIDLPGSGASPFNKQLRYIHRYAPVLINLLNVEQIPSCSIIGHSMGGYISLAMAGSSPNRVAALGLFHSTAYPDSEEKKAARKKSIEFIREHGPLAFIQQSTPGLFSSNTKKENAGVITELIKHSDNFTADALVQYYEAMMARQDRSELLVNFRKPVLFVIGEEDKAVPPEQGLKQSHLPELCYIHILEKSAHMGMLEEPHLANILLEKFLLQQAV